MNQTGEFNIEIFGNQMYRKWGMTSAIEDQVYSLKEIQSNEAVVYPKNFYKKTAKMNEVFLYSFEKEKIRTISFNEEGSITVESRLLTTIRKVKLTHKQRNYSRLTIYFNDGESIEMDSENDSDSKQWELITLIMKFYKEL